MIGPTAQQTRAAAWLNQHIPKDKSVQLSDVTSMYTAINVIGPKAQELLQASLADCICCMYMYFNSSVIPQMFEVIYQDIEVCNTLSNIEWSELTNLAAWPL